MIIEIRKAGFVNKGAQLMLHAIHERVRTAYPEAVFTMAPSPTNRSQPFRKLVDAGFYPKASLYWAGIEWGGLGAFLPLKLREMYGLVLDREVDVVIDAAGFSYGDQWGHFSIRELATSVRRWKRRGTRVVLMPQAFGPFNGRQMRKHIRQVVDGADLVIARDRTSYQYLIESVGDRKNVRQWPDFTNLLAGTVPSVFDSVRHRVCLVPNHRMIDKTGQNIGRAYLPFMQASARYLVKKGALPFLLSQGGEADHLLAQKISEAAGGLPILAVEDPMEIKGVIGSSYASIGSRYHGLVSALSNGVPSLATGWSHKYRELFHDYGVPDFIVDVNVAKTTLQSMIDRLVDEHPNAEMRACLTQRSQAVRQQSERMWREVFEVLAA